MAEAERIIGLPGNIALWRLLALRGVSLPLQALEETLLWDFSLDGMVVELRAHGFEARAVQVSAKELDHLELPTLAQVDNRDWLVLRHRAPGGYLVEQGMGGVEYAPLEMLAFALTGPALDLGEGLPEKGSLWSRLFSLLPRHLKELVMAALGALILQALSLVTPLLTGQALDHALPQGASSLLMVLSLGLVLTAIFRGWVGWLKDVTLLVFATKFEASLSKGLLEHVLWLPFRQLQKKTSGELLQAFTGLGAARHSLLNHGLGTVLSAITAFAYVILMAITLPSLTALVVGTALLMALLSILLGRMQAREQGIEVEAGQAQRSALVEMFSGLATLKATGCQDWAIHRWSKRLDVGLTHGLRRERLGLWGEIIQESLSQTLSSVILIWGGYQVLAGALSLGSLVAFTQLSAGFVAAIVSLAQAWVLLLTLKPQLRVAEELLESPRQERPPRKGPKQLPGALTVDDVWFRYAPQNPWVLQASRLRVEPGSLHHLKGPSGSGKSTLLKLVAGLYDPEKGSISVGGLDPRTASRLMMYLPQFPQLMSGSIQDNLKVFSGGATQSHLADVASDTGLTEWVNTLPMGTQTLLVSGGDNLSGGQRQLLAITALLASDKQLLLLDEALSNLDWVSRSRIINCRQFKDRTVLYASHEEILSH